MAEENKNRKLPIEEMLGDEAVEHLKAAHKAMHQSWETFLPPGFIEHRRAARKEFLLAVRSVLDKAVKRLDEKD